MRRLGLPGLIVALLVLLFVVPSAVDYYTDWLWFREMGYEGVFLRSINAQVLVIAITFAAVFVFLSLNLRFAQRTFTRPQIVLGTGVDGRAIALEGRRLSGIATWVSAGVAFIMAVSSSDDWLAWLSFFKGAPFGDRDPLFGRDIAFYVFRLPVWQTLQREALVVSAVAIVGCGLFYVLSGSFVIEPRYGLAFWPRLRLVPAARRHLALLSATLFGVLAWGAWLQIPQTLLTPANVVYGVSYADWHARIPFIWISFTALVIGAVLSMAHGFGRRGWPIPVAFALAVVTTISGSIYAGFVQAFIVTPNELDKEQPFIAYNIAATRKAYALDRVDERELSGDAELKPENIIANAGTIENVRLWDYQPLLQTFAQIQEIRTYYDFNSVDNDRYVINGKYRQVMLSARELNTENMPNRSWVNERLFFTHGYGLTLGPVNQVTTEGLPVLFIRDLPPVSTVDLRLDEPSIYYGEVSSSYALVKTRQQEFHYPRGDDNVTTFYTGTGGVPIGTFWRRLLFALRFGSTDILFTNQLSPDSRILFHRRINERVSLIAPFLKFDSDPYPVISAGRMYWLQDAYTISENYPYSTPAQTRSGSLNYIRNSVKIVIDAYNGTTTFYLAEPTDPIALTIGKIFPGLLHPLSEMPSGLRQHVRYPEDIFKIQTSIFATFHMTNPQVFYNKEDQWQLPTLDTGQNATAMQPYYTIMRLPGEKQTEFIQMLPFTPRLKDNLSAWMVARSDGDHYGHLLVFQFPKQKIVYGPRQIVGRINQDQVISPQITLWNQQGSEVIWGTLLVIPVDESLLYVRPLYLRSPEGRIPELKRVIVAYQSRIVMAETLNQALGQIFGSSIVAALSPDRLQSSATSVVQASSEIPEAPAAVGPADQTMAELAAEAKTHLDRALKAQREGDWATYGDEIKKVGEIVDKMNKGKK
ncbi:MAG TPA: UPF0182 family protein [Vicinamibacterales bacterium]|nr:UPF0182 family protein [Vicinamibacterales bacterium]